VKNKTKLDFSFKFKIIIEIIPTIENIKRINMLYEIWILNNKNINVNIYIEIKTDKMTMYLFFINPILILTYYKKPEYN
jgi:hypothetical protein